MKLFAIVNDESGELVALYSDFFALYDETADVGECAA